MFNGGGSQGSTAPTEPTAIGNLAFARAALVALLALAISAAVLLSLYPRLLERSGAALDTTPGAAVDARPGTAATPWAINGADLIVRMGGAEPGAGDSLHVTRLEEGVDSRAILTRRVALDARDYPYLEFDIRGRNLASYYYFIWRTADDPDTVHHIALPFSGENSSVRLLAQDPTWRGSVIEVGLDIYGELRDVSPQIRRLTLLPAANASLWQSIWAEWRAQRTWTQRSAHQLPGTPTETVLSPVLGAAAWAGLALLLALLLARLVRASLIASALLCLLLPWIALDLLWQVKLSNQLEETRLLFSGKSRAEKHLADIDSELYSYAQHLHSEVLPPPGAKVHLLNEEGRRGYRRLKLQYYLLPHNIFNFGKHPIRESLREGDYLIVLDEVPGLRFDRGRGELRWGDQALPVVRVDRRAPGSVYRYRGETP
ncbi:hypothetical protein E4634_13150 [Mangrovimicrobium sediminis]|uniref:Uncharacterized protein n=1 Tax=Mangrovimicrobium sediminis TaxID=2562682 RepID=A0A4Z0LZI2_9GAMM|nr:hypothetical protein [Haliea sp. SAOS-164]TGD72475.1 hypothetical protein E4634_13150 [Haliea sp. SAOS-164]